MQRERQNGMRRAFLLASLEQYLSMAIGFALVATISRLLTPEEIGLSAIGLGIAAIAFTTREFVSAEFLIQRHAIDARDVGTAFTIMAGANLLIAAVVYASAGWFADLYAAPGVAPFLTIMCAAGLADSLVAPMQALLRREMAFGTLARINTIGVATSAVATVALAAADHGFISIAWGQLAGAAARAAGALAARPAGLAMRPSLASWRSALAFGGYKGAITVIERAYEAMPQLLLGRIMPLAAVGFYNRANVVCAIPDRLVLAAVFSFAFPALAAGRRQGTDLKQPYLRALTYISVVYWPAMLLLALLADPVVTTLLGAGWEPIVTLVRIIAVAALFWFPAILTTPVLFAVGANRDAIAAVLLGRGFGAAVLVTASFHGLIALASSQLVALPVQAVVSVSAVRRRVPFAWREFATALRGSAAVTACTMAGPLALVTALGQGLELGVGHAAACTALAAAGWLAGLALVRHPFLHEVRALLLGLVNIARRGSAPRTV